MVRISDIEYIMPYVEKYYMDLHRNPELGLMEYHTSEYISQRLSSFGLEVIRGVARTGVIGVLKGEKPGKTLVLRADMDALPIQEESGLAYASEIDGVMHACGHDAHVAMLLGTAKYMSENRQSIKGTIKFLFQPAEEDFAPETVPLGDYPGGAYYVVREGHLDNADVCLAIHVNPMIKTGQILVHSREAMASTDLFRIELIGVGGHGSAPENAIDPIPALGEILVALNMLPAREFSPFSPVVLSVGTVNTISSAWNAIPERIEISGTFRTYDEEIRNKINSRIKETAEKIAEAHKCSAVYTRENGYFPTVNHPEVVNRIVEQAKEYLGKNNVITDAKPFAGGEDVGIYFSHVPGAMIFLGCSKSEEANPVDLHNPKFILDLDALGYGVMVHLNNIITFLEL